MKIGIFDPYLDTLGGGEKYMLTIAESLSLTHQVTIFWDPGYAAIIKQKTEKKFNIDLSRVIFSPSIFNKDISFWQRWQVSSSYDAIIFLSDGSIPIVGCNLYVHFQFPVEWVNAANIKTKIKFSRVKKIFCNSFFTKKFIDKKFNVQSSVLYPPADMVHSNDIKKTNTILHVGRFGMSIEGGNYKKQDIMVEAFKKMVKNGLKAWTFKMVISLASQDEEKLKTLKELAGNFPIEFIQNPNNKELALIYAQAKIYWHATGFGEDTLQFPERAEHFGIATVEAMSAGAVPVVINAGGQPEIVDNNKNGLLWNSLEELEEKTFHLLRNPNVLEDFSKAAKEKAKFFTKEKFNSNLHKIIV